MIDKADTNCTAGADVDCRAPSLPSCSGRPGFIIIGAMKSGTTTLHAYLERHPQIFLTDLKEPQFFSRDDVFALGSAWYDGLFTNARPDQICGEASTCYSRSAAYPHCAERIWNHAPQAKLIYLLRHPVDRAYSHYAHRMKERFRQGRAAVTFRHFLEEDKEALDAGLYLKQIERYLEYFPATQLRCVLFDEFVSDPAGTLFEIQDFLGLPPHDLVASQQLHNNARGERLALNMARRHVTALRDLPGVRQIVSLLPSSSRRVGRRFIQSSWLRVVAPRIEQRFHSQLDSFAAESRQCLLDFYRAPTLELQDFLRTDLSRWLD